MAHFAQLNNTNTVITVCAVDNEDVGNLPFPESEPVGVSYLKNLYGADTVWKQTSYNRNFRKHYAGAEYTYDAQLDAFIPPQPFPSWVLNTETCLWGSPIPYPSDGVHTWNEQTLSWDQIT